MKISKSLATALLLLLPCAASCGSLKSSVAYVQDHDGYSVTPGEVTLIESLDTATLESLKDGVAFTVGPNPCRVTMQFNKKESRVFDIAPGAIIVVGVGLDYLLQSQVH